MENYQNSNSSHVIADKGSSKALIIKENAVLYPAFFFLGFNQVVFYLPFFCLYFLLKLSGMGSVRIRKQYIFLSLLMLFSIVPIFVFGLDRITLENPLRTLAVLIFTVVMGGFAFQNQEKSAQIKLLSIYIIGMGLGAAIISGYSYWLSSSIYGYGRLFNPFSGTEINSPSVSNNLALFASLLFSPFFFKSKASVKLLSVLMLSIIIFFAIFLGGRAFFYITFLSFVGFLFLNFNKKTFFLSIFVSLFLGLSLLFLVSHFNDHFHLLFKRLLLGFKSPRFQLYRSGIDLFLSHPFGGYKVDTSIVNVKWFHNIFLDNGSLAGWFPVIFLLMAMIYIFQGLFKIKNKYSSIAIIAFIASILIMQQDVIIEGNYRVLMVMYFSGLFVLLKKIVVTENSFGYSKMKHGDNR